MWTRLLGAGEKGGKFVSMHASGMVVRKIADKYGISYPSVRWILHNPFYVGLLRWKGELLQGKHPPIIDQETWEAVQSSWRKSGKQ